MRLTAVFTLAAAFLTVACQGPAGPQGEAGPPGDMGAMGLPGGNGVDGMDGTNGADGADGMNGADGVNGMNGTDGVNGMDGMDGAPGAQGPQGPAGMDGADGKDGQSLTDALDAVLNNVLPNKRAIVQVICENEAGGLSAGSGVRIAEGILTAHHVLADQVSCTYFAEREPLGTGGSFRQIGGRDVALVEDIQWIATDVPVFPAPLLNQTPAVGDLVLVAGHPLALRDVQYTFGFAVGNHEGLPAGVPEGYWSEAWHHDATAIAGSSGGPVFDAQGRIIGIHVGGFAALEGIGQLDLGIALPLNTL